MKKYIAPEMEIVNFKAVDILTTSSGGGVIESIIGEVSTALSADSAVKWSNNGMFSE